MSVQITEYVLSFLFGLYPENFTFPPALSKSSKFLHILVNTCYFCYFDNKHPNGCEVASCGFDVHFTND